MTTSIIICIIAIIIADIIYTYLKKIDKLKNNLIYVIALCCGPIINIIYSTIQGSSPVECIKNAFLFILLIILINFNIKYFKKGINNQKTSMKKIKEEFKNNELLNNIDKIKNKKNK